MEDKDNKAPFFEMPNEASKLAHAKPYYGNQFVPMPKNRKACDTPHEEVIRAVLEGK